MVYWYYRKVSQGQQAEKPMITSCELHSLFILNPDDYERGRMRLNGTQSTGTRDVWYIN